jgi:hypothetical protein
MLAHITGSVKPRLSFRFPRLFFRMIPPNSPSDTACISRGPTYKGAGESSEGFSKDLLGEVTLISDGKWKA